MAQPAHSYWEHQFLHHAGLPTSGRNVGFLYAWGISRKLVGDYNPIQLSHREPGSTRSVRLPGGKWAQNYTDTQSAAEAFADQLTLSDYPDLRRALESGNPYGYKDHAGVASNLHEWGAIEFQAHYSARVGAEQSGGGARGGRPTSKNVGGAWTHLMRTLRVDGHATIVDLQRATARLNRIERRLRRA